MVELRQNEGDIITKINKEIIVGWHILIEVLAKSIMWSQ